jgi:hypothetical protein
MRRILAFLFWGVVTVVGIPVVGIVFYIALASFTGLKGPPAASNRGDVAVLSPSRLAPSGELARIFTFFSDYTDMQRDERERELKGIVVQWKLPVYNVSSGPSPFYLVQTPSEDNLVGTFCYVKPRNDDERKFLTTLKTGDYFTCKGIIDSVSMRNIVIKPAIVVLR